jgi:hypothetical protein
MVPITVSGDYKTRTTRARDVALMLRAKHMANSRSNGIVTDVGDSGGRRAASSARAACAIQAGLGANHTKVRRFRRY